LGLAKKQKKYFAGIGIFKTEQRKIFIGRYYAGCKKNIIENLKKQKEIKEISVAGSVRRQKETIGDIDILVVSDNFKKNSGFFCRVAGS